MASKKTETVVTQPEDGKVERVTIPPITVKIVEFQVIGDTPLIVQRFTEKAKRQILDKQTGVPKGPKAKKVPEQDYQDAKYVDAGTGREGMSVLSFKAAMVDSAQYVDGVTMKYLKGAFYLMPDFINQDGIPCVYIEGKSVMKEDHVRLSGLGAKTDLRYRPLYNPWRIRLRVEYDMGLIDPANLANLLNRAGFSCGVGEWRPSSKMGKSGTFGRFHVGHDQE